eukprot:CAMPEP_0170187798 /NCGR_PEP_ID=MMETSP0040_2-20121228/42622_1 /TAXON_ID=641309 /ORGANISM="Lotharella oceanica, Strain CCMP622" /LENGTH=80 /DNA_ID=CAMNT_0010434917 /DNA_START=502 /DNA_END=740 /DNA_ORIENTATION=-
MLFRYGRTGDQCEESIGDDEEWRAVSELVERARVYVRARDGHLMTKAALNIINNDDGNENNDEQTCTSHALPYASALRQR